MSTPHMQKGSVMGSKFYFIVEHNVQIYEDFSACLEEGKNNVERVMYMHS